MLRNAVLVAAVLYSVFLVVRHVLNERRHARQAAEWGCLPPPRERGTWFGIKVFRKYLAARKANRTTPFYREWQESHYPATTYVVQFLDADLFNTVEPVNFQAILATQFWDYGLGSRSRAFGPMIGKGIFTTDNAEWKHARALLRPQFARDTLADLATEEKHHQNLLKHINVQADGWTERVDLMPMFLRLMMDSSTELLFGQTVDSQLAALPSHLRGEKPLMDWSEFSNSYERGIATIAIRAFLAGMYWLYNPTSSKKDYEVVHAFADYCVNQALEETKDQNSERKPDKKYVFLHELARETRNPIELRDHLLNILIAGRDTTSGLLGWTFYLLARHHEILRQLREAIITDFGTYENSKSLDFSSLKDCGYLQRVMSEVLRLYPSVPATERFPFKDTSLPLGGGPDGKSPIYIRKGESVALYSGAMHRRKDLWGEDANEFKPDRWIKRKISWDYIPFNGGPRSCLGQQHALTIAGFMIVRLLQKFDKIENADPVQETLHNTHLTDSPLHCWVKLHQAVGN